MTRTQTEVELSEPIDVQPPVALPAVILCESRRTRVPVGKGKKRRYSMGLGTIQHLERGVAHSLATVSHGVARTFSEYSERSSKSARRKRDGALRDGIENWTKAISKGMRIAGDAPFNFVRQVNRGPGSKQVRDTVRLLTPPPLR